MKKLRLFMFLVFLVTSFALFAGGQEEASQMSSGEDGPIASFSLAYPTPSIYAQEHPNILEDQWLNELERRANVDITRMDIYPHTKRQEFYNLLFASGDLPDVFYILSAWQDLPPGILDEGVFQPLDEHLDADKYPNLMSTVPETAWKEVTHLDGHVYGVPRYLSTPVRRAVYIRKDLLDEAGLDVPVTREEFVEVLRAFKDMGVRYPYSGREYFAYENLFWGSFGAPPGAWVERDGQLVPTFIIPEFKEALTFYNMLWEDGLIDKEFLTNTGSEWRAKIHAGDVGMWTHNINSFAGWNSNVQSNVPEAELILVNSPVDENGQGGLWNYGRRNRHFSVNAQYDNVEGLMEFFDWSTTEEARMFYDFGIEGETYTINDNGTVEFTYPVNQSGQQELLWRAEFMPMIDNMAFNENLLPYQTGGDYVLEYFQTRADTDQFVHWFVPELRSVQENPDMHMFVGNVRSNLTLEAMSKIIYSVEPPDFHDEFVEEWLERGGEEVIAEANKYHREGQTFPFE